VRAAGVEHQTDTYFVVPQGRLKLRVIEGQPAVLIAYNRPDETHARTSSYYLVTVPDPATLRAALTSTLGVRGEVRKRREIYLYHNVRIHLDDVAELGTFIEFEAILTGEVTPAEAEADAHLETLRHVLEILTEDFLAPSYADLMGF
jgi:predicted adenylyl cyclase CyaB